MSVTLTAYASNTLGTFVDSDYDGPNWSSLPIDATSSSTQVTSTFTFEGLHVVATFTGSFGANPASLGTLSGIFSQPVTGFSAVVDGVQLFAYQYSPGVSLSNAVAMDMGNNASVMEQVFSGNDTFIGSLQSNSDGDNDWVNGYGGNDIFYGNAGSTGHDGFYGGAGSDTAVFRGNRADYSIASIYEWMNGYSGPGFVVTDHAASRDGTTELLSVERLQFADAKVALDNNGVQAMEFIGIVAPSLLSNLHVRGAILNLFDGGKSMEQLCQLALDAGLLPTSSNTDLANTVFHNVLGGTASTQMTNALVNYIETHGQANFLATIAEMHVNVDVVGLAQTGVEYA